MNLLYFIAIFDFTKGQGAKFEYIGEMGKDYIYAVTPLLEDALMDR